MSSVVAPTRRANSLLLSVVRVFPLLQPRLYWLLNGVRKRTFNRKRARTYFGSLMDCGSDDLLQKYVIDFGFWEPNVSHLMATTLMPGDVFVDVGANAGYCTLLGSKSVGDTGRVVSIEASPVIFEMLEHNLSLNSANNVRCVNLAVSDRAGTVKMYAGPSYNTGMSTTVESRGFSLIGEVGSEALSEILNDDERARVKLIKIDVEGAEPPILQQILKTLALYPPEMKIICEVSEDARGWKEVFLAMRQAGFAAYLIENKYPVEWYLNWRAFEAPRKLEEHYVGLYDVMFTRQPID